MSDPLVSIIMRSFNEGWALRETLPALQAQDYQNWELIVIDSGSTDGSVDMIRQANPRHFIQIEPGTYNPSRVMNHGMELAQSEFGIFLNADATPQNPHWLRPLVNALQGPAVAAVFGRQIPRPDCRAVYAHDYERCFGPQRDSEHWEHFFSMVSSGLRKDVWAQRGFLEKMQYSEDDEYTRWCRAEGFRVVYCPESVVMHSHNYTAEQAYRRSFGEAKALAAVWTGNRHDVNWRRTVVLGWINDLRRDASFCAREGRLKELPHAARIRWRQRMAKLTGFREGWKFYREREETDSSAPGFRASQVCPRVLGALEQPRRRFTIDGSEALENQIAGICQQVATGVTAMIPTEKVETIVLGGGYGRGQGGVLRTEAGDQPYNDLEFYIFVRGNPVLNNRKFRRALDHLGESLSPAARLHVEFKIDSLAQWRRAPVSMFSYDLVAGHHIVLGDSHVFDACQHHLEAQKIPLSEATRLLFNRCTGLLLAKEMLRQPALTTEQRDFIGRNLAKAQLAFGDAMLTLFGAYHWSVLERGERLARLTPAEPLPWFDEVRQRHAAAVEFKLRPVFCSKRSETLAQEHREVSELALKLWLWLESRRLGRRFTTPCEYAFDLGEKCWESAARRNFLLNLRTFGARAALDPLAWRYPRERLFNALPLLLWDGDEAAEDTRVRTHLQQQLQSKAADWAGFLSDYKQIWPSYG
jgi:rhamnosyltransferase